MGRYNAPMAAQSADNLQMLRTARQRAQRLVGELSGQMREVAAHPPELPPDQLAQGQAALAAALASADRMLRSLEAALQSATSS